MAFSIPWLETVSKRERQRREEKAQRLMFPFGDEQRTAELAVLRHLSRRRRETRIYCTSCSKRRTVCGLCRTKCPKNSRSGWPYG